jgi:hypothetical protein
VTVLSHPARSTRAERMANPTARDTARAVAENHGVCQRPVQLRRIDTQTGQAEQVMVPCGATFASVCPACAERAKNLRIGQCREGWHLEVEPIDPAPAPTAEQAMWLELRAEAQRDRDNAAETGQDTTELDEVIRDLDAQLKRCGIRGQADPGTPKPRRHRSTRRRQDVLDLPKRKISPHTVGKTYTARDGTTYRPSMFVTLTCDSYGKVDGDGVPVNPASYDYTRAARDALHFAALFDRFVQNLRRVMGQDVQYFATIEPQKRLAPHAHIAIRGTLSRAELRQIIAATYHQVWWPAVTESKYEAGCLPVWDGKRGRYLDPSTGELLASWDDALDAIGPEDEPRHVARLGREFHAEGVLGGSKDAARCIGYLTKYLTKHLGDCHHADTPGQQAHVDRLADALACEPCSPACANWLLYGIEPKNARPGLAPGHCKGKAHRREHLGYAGRRVLVSRRWSGKTLADHRGDRKAWLMEHLGIPATDQGRYRWEPVKPTDPDHIPPGRRLLYAVADRLEWETALREARRRAQEALTAEVSAAGRAA